MVLKMEVNNYKRKFRILFEKFFQENFELSNYYSRNLLKYLEESPDKNAEKILDTPYFSDLLLYSLNNIEKASTSVKIFIVDVFTIVVKNELQFSKLTLMNGFNMLHKLCGSKAMETSGALHLACIKQATAQTSHFTGINWLVTHKVWKWVLYPNIHKKPAYISRAAYDFISKLVWKLNEYEEEVGLTEVLKYVVEPILANDYQMIKIIDVEREKAIYETSLAFLNSLLAILDDTHNIMKPNMVVHLLARYYIVEPPLNIMFEMTRDPNLTSLLAEICFRFCFAAIAEAFIKSSTSENELSNDMTTGFYNIVLCLLKKRMISVTMDFVIKCNIFWSKTGTSVLPSTFERYGRTFEVQNQFILLLVVPLLKYSGRNNNNNSKVLEGIDLMGLKLSKVVTEHILKAGYHLRGVLNSEDLLKVTIAIVKNLFRLKGHINTAQAGIIYQALFYVLQRYVSYDATDNLIANGNPLKSPDDVKLLSLTIEAITMLLKGYNINWYENCEIICLQCSLMNLMKQNILPNKLLLQTIELINICVNKFLSPEMTLLVDNKSGGTLSEVGVMMKSYILNEEWEIRDSALQLLLCCTEIAFVKYMPLQKVISRNNLIILAAEAAVNDTEYYVQVTALKCLAAATKMDNIWREVLNVHQSLYLQIFDILKNNTEGIIRKEAANVLKEIFINQKVSDGFTSSMYKVMSAAATRDLHWEVQLNALIFWKHAIRETLSHRGMIDGKFPNVTFSKVKRKIIAFDQKEIEKQLIEIMNDLSSSGCLAVLHKCLTEDSNIEVLEVAHCIAKHLVDILDFYKFNEVPRDQIVTPILTTNIKRCISEDILMDLSHALPNDIGEEQQHVIDKIVNTDRSELISDMYKNYIEVKTDFTHINETFCRLHVDVINPNIFLENLRKTNYEMVIKSKKKWNSGCGSLDVLLDEVLTLGEVKQDDIDKCT